MVQRGEVATRPLDAALPMREVVMSPEPPPGRRGLRSWFANRDEGLPRRPLSPTQRRVLAFTWAGIFSMLIYALSMVFALFQPGYSLADRVASVFLVGGIFFILLHGFGFANSMLKAS